MWASANPAAPSRRFQWFTRATRKRWNLVPPERKVLSFVLADADEGMSVDEVSQRIEKQTSLRAVTGEQFEWITMWYYMRNTGIPFNFGITVILGFIVGTAIAAQAFYLFTIENIKQYGGTQGDGRGQLEPDGNDFAASPVGERYRFPVLASARRPGSARSPIRRAPSLLFTCRPRCLWGPPWPSAASAYFRAC